MLIEIKVLPPIINFSKIDFGQMQLCKSIIDHARLNSHRLFSLKILSQSDSKNKFFCLLKQTMLHGNSSHRTSCSW